MIPEHIYWLTVCDQRQDLAAGAGLGFLWPPVRTARAGARPEATRDRSMPALGGPDGSDRPWQGFQRAGQALMPHQAAVGGRDIGSRAVEVTRLDPPAVVACSNLSLQAPGRVARFLRFPNPRARMMGRSECRPRAAA